MRRLGAAVEADLPPGPGGRTHCQQRPRTFGGRFLALWAEHSAGDAFPNAMFWPPRMRPRSSPRALLSWTAVADMLGFGACKMIRRILGFAHVLDLDGIGIPTCARMRARRIGHGRRAARHPEHFKSIDDVTEAVPRLQPHTR